MRDAVASLAAQLAVTPPPGSTVQASAIVLPGQGPTHDLPGTWPPWLRAVAQAQGVVLLTTPQQQALDRLRQGQHVCFMAPTGAGRGMVRLLALYQSLAAEQRGHALGLFPNKLRELAQSSVFATWNAALEPAQRLSLAIYDGDTPGTQRRAIKQAPPRLLLTTPEMLHAGILAYHGGWRAFFQELRYVLLPDVHLCGGALGTHLAHLLRRVQRLAVHYGAQPRYLLTSAPLTNMAEVAQALTGQTCTVVSGTAWQRQPQHRLMLSAAADPVAICQTLSAACHHETLRPLVLAPAACVAQLSTAGSDAVLAHETPLAAVRSRSCQSLICLGIPSSLAQLHDYLAWLGSNPLPSLGCLVLSGQTPLEQYLLRYPAVYETLWPQSLALYPSNPGVASYHLHCAAAELALAAGERYTGIHGVGTLIQQLAADQKLTRHSVSGAWVASERSPHRRASLRAYEPTLSVVRGRDEQVIGRLAPAQAFREAFEGAIYTPDGTTWQVQRVFPERRRLLVQAAAVDYVTRGRLQAAVTARQVEASVVSQQVRFTYGACHYAETLTAYERLDPQTRARRSVHVLPQQQRQYTTQALWLADTAGTTAALSSIQTAWHTLVHAVLAGLPLLLANATPGVRGGVYGAVSAPEAVFSDDTSGGNGVSALMYQAQERLLRVALQVLLPCDCTHGCPRCLTASGCDTCGSQVGVERQAGVALLQRLLGEAVPTFASTAQAEPRRSVQTPRLVYLVLRTQNSAEAVGGWQHRHLLGLGVAVTYDTSEGRMQVYTAETASALLTSLRQADLVIGFNTQDFEYQVLQPYTEVPLASLPTLAVLHDVQQALGFRLSLRHLVRETLGIERPDDSAQTLTWYQEGDRERIVQQCQRDLTLLRQLVRYGAQTGSIFYRDQAGVRTAVPVHWQRCSDDG